MSGREIRLTTPKTRWNQFIPIARPFLLYLKKLEGTKDSVAPVFPTLHPNTLKTGGSAQLSASFRSVLEEAKLVAERSASKKSTGVGQDATRAKSEISFHSLRHTTTSLLKKAGVPESVTMDIIGHGNAAMSANYTHTDDDSRRQAVDKLPDITLIRD